MKKSKFAPKMRATTKLAKKLVIGGLAAAFMLTAASPALIAVNAAANVPTASTSITQPQTSPAATVVFTIGSTTYTVNGVARQLTAAPFIDGELTMIPIQPLADVIGAEVVLAANGVYVNIRRRWENGDFSPTEHFSTALRNEAGPPAVMIDGQVFQPLSLRESGSVRFASWGRFVDSSWQPNSQTVILNIPAITFQPPHSVTFANNEGFRVSPERVPAWILPEQRTGEDHEPYQFELDVLEELNALIVANGGDPFTWHNIVAANARWLAEQLREEDIVGGGGIIVTRSTRGRVFDVHPNNFTPKAVAEEIFISVHSSQLFGGSSVKPSVAGVGFDVERGYVLVSLARATIYDLTDVIPGLVIETIGSFGADTPYSFVLNEEFTPFALPYMLAYGRYNGMTDEEIEEWIIAEWEPEIIRLVNEMRVAHGLRPVERNSSLDQAARSHRLDTRARQHTGGDGSTPLDRARRAGWQGNRVGENIGGGESPMIDVAGWMMSSGHRAIMLNPDYTHTGLSIGMRGDLTSRVELLHWSAPREDRFGINGGLGASASLSSVQLFGTR